MTITTYGYKGPLPNPDFRQQVADEVMPPFMDVISGEVSATVSRSLGVARFKGRVKRVIMSVAADGAADTPDNTPRISGEVTINKTSIFTTKPSIGHISGETPAHKTTFSENADTGVVAAVINESASSFNPGDIIDWTAIYSGSANPGNKIQSPGILVEVEPV